MEHTWPGMRFSPYSIPIVETTAHPTSSAWKLDLEHASGTLEPTVFAYAANHDT